MIRFFICLIFTTLANSLVAQNPPALYRSSAFTVFPDAVVQGEFRATAVSRTEISSDYVSPANRYLKPVIDFKFSINGKDNEMESGKDHHYACADPAGDCTTPLIKFGEQLKTTSAPQGQYLGPDTRFSIRLDMRHVFNAFEKDGYYQSFNGNKIYKADFKGVYVAGGTAPLTWDFDNLHHFRNLELQDSDGDHIYELTLILNSTNDKRKNSPLWKLETDVSAYPQYSSDYRLIDALYNLSLEEMTRAIEKDSTLRTGKEWAGVWTRDVSYSIILSMAILQPRVAQYSLMKKVNDGVIVQDTGTGGAYPISTDRIVWALAAWEIYKTTGDVEWLKEVYPIIKKSIESDLVNAFDERTGLMRGESSFLDWREQTYPEWMEPADIFESLCLGTNAVHYQANRVLANMARLLNERETVTKHERIAAGIRESMNKHLWMNRLGYYGQFLYGRGSKMLSPKSEALGEALCVLFDIASSADQARIVSATPVVDFGTPCVFPQIPNIPPYHNDAVWPFVQAYWAMAAAKTGNETALMHSLAAIWRPGALFLTNKENFVASTGDFASTQINSDNMLWSLSGNIAMIYKALFGINYNEQSITFTPCVPASLAGRQTLKNFRYRGATLDIDLTGHGNRIESIAMDGRPLKNARVPASLKGHHTIKIVMADNHLGGKINLQENRIALPAPRLHLDEGILSWTKVPGAEMYRVIRNGEVVSTQKDTAFSATASEYTWYQVIATDNQTESFASEPLPSIPENRIALVNVEDVHKKYESSYKGFAGSGYVRTSTTLNPEVSVHHEFPDDGVYRIDFRYANGNGPVNTDNKCAIRTLKVDGTRAGIIVLAQRGKDEWSDWGFTNSVDVTVKKGRHNIVIIYEKENANMNGAVNEAVIDFVRIIQIR